MRSMSDTLTELSFRTGEKSRRRCNAHTAVGTSFHGKAQGPVERSARTTWRFAAESLSAIRVRNWLAKSSQE